jgi:predicted kinase
LRAPISRESIMREAFIEFIKTELKSDVVLIACGLPATYKTETTEVVAELKGYHILRTDLIRLEVLKDEDIFDEKVASDMKKRELVYDKMFAWADELVEQYKGLILDATFITQELRVRAAQIAARHDKVLVIQQTQCPQEVSLRRIAERTREDYESNALTEQAYLNNKRKFQPVDLEDLKSLYPALTIIHLLVDTTSDLAEEWAVIGKTVM